MSCLPREAALLDDGRDAVQADLGGEGMLAQTGALEEDYAALGKIFRGRHFAKLALHFARSTLTVIKGQNGCGYSLGSFL